jgi:protein-disulfide isomerase
MGRNPGVPLVVSAVILAAAIVGGAVMIKSSLDTGTQQLEGVSTALASLEKAVKESAPPARLPVAAQRPSGPDPDKRHAVKVDGAPILGPAQAPVTLVEFSDFQCPFCSRVYPTLQQIRQEYGDKVRIVFKHYPLSFHTKAPAAHAAAEAAHRQGKFWEMHDKIFANQREMSEEKYVAYAQELGLDVEKFKQDLASADVKQRVDEDTEQASGLGVRGTPTFFINGKFLSGAQPIEAFKRVIDEELAG